MKSRLAIALLGALSISAATATTLTKMEVGELAAQATTVVVGEVTASSTKQTVDGMYTLTTVSVKDTMWGDASKTVTVAFPGGSQTIGKLRVGTVVPGAPNLFVGRKVVLFLTEDAAHGGYSIVGFNQGLLDVVQTAEGDSVQLPGIEANTSLPKTAAKVRELKASQAKPAARTVQP